MITLRVADKFGRYPGGRYEDDGPFSGEEFRKSILVPALIEAQGTGGKLVVDIDGVIGFAASFLEEAFGGLVRYRDFEAHALHGLMEIKSSQSRFDIYRDAIWQYIDEARPGDVPAAAAH